MAESAGQASASADFRGHRDGCCSRSVSGLLLVGHDGEGHSEAGPEDVPECRVPADAVAGGHKPGGGEPGPGLDRMVQAVKLLGHAVQDAANQGGGAEIVQADSIDGAGLPGVLSGAQERGADCPALVSVLLPVQQFSHDVILGHIRPACRCRIFSEEPLQGRIGAAAAQCCPHQQIAVPGEGPGLDALTLEAGMGQHGNLGACPDVHQPTVAVLAHRAQEAGLIVPYGDADGDAAESAQRQEFFRDRGQEIRGGAPFFYDIPQKIIRLTVIQAQACGLADMDQGSAAPCQRHAHIVGYGTQGDRFRRDEAFLQIVQMGCQAVAGSQFCAVGLSQAAADAHSVVIVRQVPPPVLPGVERAHREAAPVQVEDAVHLTGEADGGHIAPGGEQPLQSRVDFCQDGCGILKPFPGAGAGKEGIVGERDGLDERAVRKACEDEADAGGSDVDADAFHGRLLCCG